MMDQQELLRYQLCLNYPYYKMFFIVCSEEELELFLERILNEASRFQEN